MAFNWKEFYDLATKLDADIPSSNLNAAQIAIARTCVNRAYYAAHWHCRQFLKNKHNLEIQNPESHQKTIDGVRPHLSTKVHDYLVKMKTRRNEADYDDEPYFSKMDITVALSRYAAVKLEIDQLYGQN